MRKIICSFPRQVDSHVFDELYRSGKLELELVPQGNLAERIRAAGAGIGAFFMPTGYGTELAKGKETREIDGKQYVLEYPIHGDVALIKAERGDRWGNLVYRKAARNFGPVMATAAKLTVATRARDRRSWASSTPRAIVTPGIYVSKIVKIDARRHAGRRLQEGGMSMAIPEAHQGPARRAASRRTSTTAPTSTSASACRRTVANHIPAGHAR